MSICARCGNTFECGMADASAASEPCWCTRLPVLPADAAAPDNSGPAAGGCYCPYCLRGLLAAAGMPAAD